MFELASSRLELKRAISRPQPPPTKPEVPTSCLTPAANAVTVSSRHSPLCSPTTTTTTQHSHDDRTGTGCPTPHMEAPDGKAVERIEKRREVQRRKREGKPQQEGNKGQQKCKPHPPPSPKHAPKPPNPTTPPTHPKQH